MEPRATQRSLGSSISRSARDVGVAGCSGGGAAGDEGEEGEGRGRELKFLSAMLVNCVDAMGTTFAVPVLIPYGKAMGAEDSTIAAFATAHGACAVVSKLWMPWLSDRSSRRLVVLLSVGGSTLAYLLQALSGSLGTSGARIALFMAARGLAGLFNGTAPVLRSYVAELFEDEDVLKQRLVYLNLASMAIGMTFAPLAGLLASAVGLQCPFYTCTASGLAGCLWVFFFFKEATGGGGGEDGGGTAGEGEGEGEGGERGWKNPWCDTVLLLAFVSQALGFFVVIGGLNFLVPLMLYQESVGIGPFGGDGPGHDLERERNVAYWAGLVGVPVGACNVLVSVCFFVPVTRALGDVATLSLTGILATCCIAAYGSFGTTFGRLCVMQGLWGCCLGLMAPAAAPLVARYAKRHYEHQLAEVQSIPLLGKALVSVFSANVVERVSNRHSLRAAWWLCAACWLLFTGTLTLAAWLVEADAAAARAEAPARAKRAAGSGGGGGGGGAALVAAAGGGEVVAGLERRGARATDLQRQGSRSERATAFAELASLGDFGGGGRRRSSAASAAAERGRRSRGGGRWSAELGTEMTQMA